MWMELATEKLLSYYRSKTWDIPTLSSQIVSVLLCTGGVPLVAFYSFRNQCANGKHSSNSTLLMSGSGGSSCKEQSTALGYVVST